ncbi:MAG: penicillin-binding protein activator LpoB [Gammaproteobacteria bacterium]
MRIIKRFGIVILAAWLAGCSTVQTVGGEKLAGTANWALLPFANHTETPQAGLRAEAIAASLLRGQGVARLQTYPAGLVAETLLEPADRQLADKAMAWAREQGVRYAVRGEVNEWRYKVGIDGEPAVGLTLQVLDLNDGRVVYSAAGGKSGWSREALSAVAQKLMKDMVAGIPLTK